ncbi:FK506-binding protein 5 isoform X2 [Hyposmocoma kahamanoa]|uniref:FK506-binding protein 5 isoform X2 n=1 Tax=Hyposmocoma kahamanoa TaxID=1477025 RepID=UPI000E6D7116|nr:FK506-binding protein 5 isoform X2 [Hyposmocoma kahamanoa]
MTTATTTRKSISIHDYPEHLNPFREDDNHSKIRFWTMGRKLNRSNSINFTGIKELKNSWAFRSFMRKGKKQAPAQESKTQINGDSSPILYRRALQYSSSSTAGPRSTVGSPEVANRYVYAGSVTPLPRSRFQERLRSASQNEVNSLCETPRMARSEALGSEVSVESAKPFGEYPVPPVRASRRKKKRAPPPPPGASDVSVISETSETLQITEQNKKKDTESDLDIEGVNLDVELKIVEDEDLNKKTMAPDANGNVTTQLVEATIEAKQEPISKNKALEIQDGLPTKPPRAEDTNKNSGSDFDILNSVSFPKVDIIKYRRNSSVNEDDIRLRRGNLEDFHTLSNKRSKSLTNTTDSPYVTYDINLNENSITDTNANKEPQKVICKLYENTSRKQSIDTISSTEKEFMEIDKVRREIEQEVIKLNAALEEDFSGPRLSVSDIKKKFDKNDVPTSPNPIPKPKRSNCSDCSTPSPVNAHGL